MTEGGGLSLLPNGWTWTNFEAITKNLDGKRVPVNDKDRQKMKGTFPYYGASGIIDYVNDYLFDGEFLLIGEDGANLLSRSTPIAFLAKGKFWVNNHAHILATYGDIPLQYVALYINSISLVQWVTGTAQPKLNQARMKTIPVPLAPLQEQKRIVGKVEELFSFLDAGVASLHAVQVQLKRYRQAVLKAAFEGKLTEQWRQSHRNILDIKKEFLESAPDEKDNSRIPNEWGFVSLSMIAQVSVGYVGPISKYYTKPDKGIPMLSTANISDKGIVGLNELNYVNQEFVDRICSKKIFPGDIIIARHGDSGNATQVPKSIKEAFCLNAVIIRPSAIILSRYLELIFWFKGTKERLSIKKSGSVQSIIGTTALKQFKIPVPPVQEQKMIIEAIESYLSIINAAENAIEESCKNSASLRQSILKAAFMGKLVPQDPNEEPAEKLLERITPERFQKKSNNDNQVELSYYVK